VKEARDAAANHDDRVTRLESRGPLPADHACEGLDEDALVIGEETGTRPSRRLGPSRVSSERFDLDVVIRNAQVP